MGGDFVGGFVFDESREGVVRAGERGLERCGVAEFGGENYDEELDGFLDRFVAVGGLEFFEDVGDFEDFRPRNWRHIEFK